MRKIVFIIWILHFSLYCGAQDCFNIPKLDELKVWFSIDDNYEYRANSPYRLNSIVHINDVLYMINNERRKIGVYFFDFKSEQWIPSIDSTLYNAIDIICNNRAMPIGLRGVEIYENLLFTTGITERWFSALELETHETSFNPIVNMPEYPRSELAAGIAYSPPIVYLAFHALAREVPIEESQQLFGINHITGEILFNAPLDTAINRSDYVHALTTDSRYVWHLKDSDLIRMDKDNGKIIDKYVINKEMRPTSMSLHNQSLWIATVLGDLYELPLNCDEEKY